MGLFKSIFRFDANDNIKPTDYVIDKTIPESEKQYYQPDSYYTLLSHPDTLFEYRVIPYEERKEKAIPSANGLYVPEILLLYFCGNFPNPKNGYPGYWWFTYGVRNVGAMLISLLNRGFIVLGASGKYELTDIGKEELKENEYVIYMHKYIKRIDFTAWELNIMLGTDDKSNYMFYIEKETKANEDTQQKHQKETYSSLKKIDRKRYKKLKNQDEQLDAILLEENRYKETQNIDELILFWEYIWSNGGLLFDGMKWMFRLPDLYIKVGRYEDALKILDRIKKPMYADKVISYRDKIAKKMNK